jgi:aspartyl/glutamyl-tRNA(Asn/Gln) amidotransferase C subunit
MTGVDAAEVEHIAALARIDLDDAEIERFVAEFETILGYFEQLDAVPEVPTDAETRMASSRARRCHERRRHVHHRDGAAADG